MGELQHAFAGRIRAVERRVVVAVRVERLVEIDRVDAARRAIELEVPARRIGLRPARHVLERHEQAIQAGTFLDIRAKRQRLAFQRELEHAHALMLPNLAGGGHHLDEESLGRRIQRCRHGVLRIRRKVLERQELISLARRHRLVWLVPECLIFGRALDLNPADIIATGFFRRRIARIAAG